MRDYSRVSPKFWVGSTGKQIRRLGPEAQVLALYMVTSPHANMIGLYYLPVPYMTHETGLSPDSCARALRSLQEVGFCSYDAESEVIWVREMARIQLGDAGPGDKQRRGAAKQYDGAPECAFLGEFFDKYSAEMPIKSRREGLAKPLASPPQALPIQATATATDTATATSVEAREKGFTQHDGWPARISSVRDLEVAVASWGWSAVGLGQRERARAHRIVTAGPIERHEWESALPKTNAKPTEERARYFLGVVEGARNDAAREADKPSPPPRGRDPTDGGRIGRHEGSEVFGQGEQKL